MSQFDGSHRRRPGTLVESRYVSVQPTAASGSVDQCHRTESLLSEIPERNARSRCPAVARRARTEDLRKYFGGSLEIVGRTDEDDSQRVSPDAVAERGTGTREEAHGRFFLRRGSCTASRLRPATSQVATAKSGRVFRLPQP